MELLNPMVFFLFLSASQAKRVPPFTKRVVNYVETQPFPSPSPSACKKGPTRFACEASFFLIRLAQGKNRNTSFALFGAQVHTLCVKHLVPHPDYYNDYILRRRDPTRRGGGKGRKGEEEVQILMIAPILVDATHQY